jgi:hypothetical protein
MEDNLKIWKVNISATTGRTLLKFENRAIGIKQERTKVSNKDDLNKIHPQNINSQISATSGWILLK